MDILYNKKIIYRLLNSTNNLKNIILKVNKFLIYFLILEKKNIII
jgi:hypothetical protein